MYINIYIVRFYNVNATHASVIVILERNKITKKKYIIKISFNKNWLKNSIRSTLVSVHDV